MYHRFLPAAITARMQLCNVYPFLHVSALDTILFGSTLTLLRRSAAYYSADIAVAQQLNLHCSVGI